MSDAGVPDGARAAARVLILDSDRRLLMFQAQDGAARWWVAPGGGLEPGESFEEAARREAEEETGFSIELGPWVWTRHHRYVFDGRQFDQYERAAPPSGIARRHPRRAVSATANRLRRLRFFTIIL